MWLHSYIESNEQTELTSKTDRLIDGEQDDSKGKLFGVEELGKKEKGLMDMDNSVVIAVGNGV